MFCCCFFLDITKITTHPTVLQTGATGRQQLELLRCGGGAAYLPNSYLPPVHNNALVWKH